MESWHTELTDAGEKREEKRNCRELATYIWMFHGVVGMSNFQ